MTQRSPQPRQLRCRRCDYRTGKWLGFCPQCRAEGSLAEDGGPGAEVVPIGDAPDDRSGRRTSTIGEVDRVLGGGFVRGAAVLVGGEPGVGKSTLLLQVAGGIARAGGSALIASAEESVGQIAQRAARVGADEAGVSVAAGDDVDAIVAAAEAHRPDLLVVDSIQTVASREVSGAPGGVSQVRSCGSRLVTTAKRLGMPTVLVGHVTKDGAIAGPRVLEHTVDVTLYLEGEDAQGLRFLRSLKNRFGPVHQVGFFEMGERGLGEVPDPTQVLLHRGVGEAAGAVVFPSLEGRRPVLVEVQALVAAAATQPPRRSVKGLDVARLHQVLAVLERHVGMSFAALDVYVSVVGGIRVREPAIDMAIALAVVSSRQGIPVGTTAAWGEIGLTGELREVGQGARRRDEAARLGFDRIVAPDDGSVPRIADALGRAGLLHHLRVPSIGRLNGDGGGA
jgi:DNA repair protein RadA/Sms